MRPPFWIMLVSVPALAVIAGLSAIALLVRLVLFFLGRRPQRFFAPFYRAHLWIVPLAFLVAEPIFVSFFATSTTHTREDEAYYQGPDIDDTGRWTIAQRLRRADQPKPKTGENRFTVWIESKDGLRLRGFLVPPQANAKPRAVAVLAHGLFRGALEIERVGSKLRDLGVEVLLLELRNHGGSGAKKCTFGRDESGDVIAAVEFVRSRDEAQGLPLVVYGVSLGAAAVSLAAPRLDPPPAALVLDSPMATLEEAADHQLESRIGFPAPYRFLNKLALRAIGGISFDAVRPVEELPKLSKSVVALVVGGENDEMMRPEDVRRVFESLGERDKTLWVVPGSRHGAAIQDQPLEYERHLAQLLDKIAPR